MHERRFKKVFLLTHSGDAWYEMGHKQPGDQKDPVTTCFAHLRMFRQCTGKKHPANMITTATSILAAFLRVRNWPIVLELAGGQGFRKSVGEL